MTFKDAIDLCTEQAHREHKPLAVLVADMTGEPVEDVAKFVAITLDYLRDEGGLAEIPGPEDGDPNDLPADVKQRLGAVCTALAGTLQLGFNLGQAKATEIMDELSADLSDLPDAPETA